MFSLLRSLFATLKSGLFKRTVIYTLSSSLIGLISFLLLPIFTRYLSQYDYGIVETFDVVAAFLTGLLSVGGTTLLARKYFGLNLKERKSYLAHILEITFINGLLVLVIFLIFGDFLSNLIKLNETLLLLIVLVAFANMVTSVLLTLFQLERSAGKYAIFSNFKLLIEIGLSLFLIVVVGLKWEGRITGIVLSSLLSLVIAILIFWGRKIRLSFSAKYFKELYFLGLPLIMVHMSGWANNMADKLMINNLISVEGTGLYSVGYRFGMIIMMLEVAFSQAWLPFFYEKIERNNMIDKLKIVRVTYVYSVVLTIFALFFGFFGKYLLHFMVDEKFYAASQFIFLIAMAYCFDGIGSMFGGYLIYKRKTGIYSLIILFSAIVNVVLNFILLPRIGLIGAAWATFISFAIVAILSIIIGSKSYPMPWFSKELIRGILPK